MKRSPLQRGTSQLKRTQIARKTDAARLRQRRAMQTTKPRTGSRRELIRQLDNEVRRIVRARDISCVTPTLECFGDSEVSHFFRRGYQRIKWDLRNTALQCQYHNQQHNTDRRLYTHFIYWTYGEAIMEELETSRQNHAKLSDVDLQSLLAELRAARATLDLRLTSDS